MCRRSALLWILVLLLAPLSSAATPPADPFPADPFADTPSPVLALPFPDSLPGGPATEWSQVEIEIYANGQQLASERLEVRRPTEEERGLVQILATRPAESATLTGMIERGRVQVEAALTVDGIDFGRFAGQRLLERPAQGASRVRLLDLRYAAPTDAEAPLFEVATAAGQDCSERNACTWACNEDYRACLDSGTCFPQITCDECENQRIYCINSCPPCECVDPKSVTTETRTYQVDAYYSGYWQCYEEPFGYDYHDGYYYDEYVRVYRQDEVEVTTYCDPNKEPTERVVSTTYIYSSCWVNTYITCYHPFSKAYPTC